jgi:tetratricopeptide (TPR) repeat protein
MERLAAARTATQVDPTLASAYKERGDALLELGRRAAAVDAYQRRTQVDAGNAGAWLQLGSALDWLDRYAEAADTYARMLALNPTHSDAHY